MNQPTNQPINQSTNQPINQSTNQPINQSTNQNNKTVAVVTSTIGHPELSLAIKSVQNQTYPCKHYVFVDGNIFWDKAKSIFIEYYGGRPWAKE
ncbi:PT domain-containing protein [Haemophilus influenzae]|uniref:PT domain-containing protein n=1 Tax=Haemophilus influenzae TaxID=727 RepID=UPI000E341D3B|nr:glycosyl transferase [Haemophilus influenzae]